MDKNVSKGQAKQIKGEIKDVVGGATKDRKMQAEGKVDKAVGKVQEGYGKAKDAMREKH